MCIRDRLSVPSKILESVVNDTIARHVYKANNLVTDKQWAYHAGFSTELLLIQLTETWREAVDAGLVVAVAFIDFNNINNNNLPIYIARIYIC